MYISSHHMNMLLCHSVVYHTISYHIIAFHSTVYCVVPYGSSTANLPTNMVDFGGFDSSIMLILRGGIPRPHGGFPGRFDSSNVSGVQC